TSRRHSRLFVAARARYHRRPMPEDRDRHDVLVRITDTPQLARVVPLLPPWILHAVITQHGLQDCGELLALTTAEQLSAIFDLDLWKAPRPGDDEEFGPA